MAGKGKIIGGVILLVIGIIIAGWGMTINSIQSNNLQQCNSITGELGQSFDPETAEICANAPIYQGMSISAIFIGLVLFAIGIVLVILRAFSRSKREEEKVERIVSPSREDNVVSYSEKIYCRYCGKQREASGEFCSRCGRSTHSTSNNMKICRNCSSRMGEDSEFCANCGQKFEEKSNLTQGSRRFYYTSDGKKKEMP